MKLSAITVIRNEQARIKEWIEFHSNFYDIDLFLIYLDNCTDNTENIIKELQNKYNIEYKYTDAIGNYTDNHDLQETYAGARVARHYSKGFNLLKYDYDWIAVFDVDEFITPININNFNLKNSLNNSSKDIYYLPMYCFKPPFDINKSIYDQNYFRWSDDTRNNSGHGGSGKSIIRGKIHLDLQPNIHIHTGPLIGQYSNNLENFNTSNTEFYLQHFQSHMTHARLSYDTYDDSIVRMHKLYENSKSNS